MIFLGLFGYMITTRYSGNHIIIGWIVFGIVLGYLVDEIRQVRSNSISLLIMASTHYAFFIMQFFCTIMLKPKDNLYISKFERSSVQVIALCERPFRPDFH